MSALIQVINSGSSSIKYQLFDLSEPDHPQVWARGLISRIGEPEAELEHEWRIGLARDAPMESVVVREPILDHDEGFAALSRVFDATAPVSELGELRAFGHRVVHGGDLFAAPAVVDDAVLEAIAECVPLAPLHNPANLAGITAARTAHPGVPNVAVFDTAFHQSMAPAAYTYALDRLVASRERIRRYGFHGTSHSYVSREAARFLELDPTSARIISLHLGNGASACAVRGGKSVDTSMGMTPLEGLVMGTRSGDLDPAILLHLQRQAGMSADEVDDLVNRRSGLRGLCGDNDLREVHRLADSGDSAAVLALEVYIRRIRSYLASYLMELRGAEAIVFTAGVGEHDARVRAEVCAALDWLGVRIDSEANEAPTPGTRVISTPDSAIAVLVVPTDEELEIARLSLSLLG